MAVGVTQDSIGSCAGMWNADLFQADPILFIFYI